MRKFHVFLGLRGLCKFFDPDATEEDSPSEPRFLEHTQTEEKKPDSSNGGQHSIDLRPIERNTQGEVDTHTALIRSNVLDFAPVILSPTDFM